MTWALQLRGDPETVGSESTKKTLLPDLFVGKVAGHLSRKEREKKKLFSVSIL